MIQAAGNIANGRLVGQDVVHWWRVAVEGLVGVAPAGGMAFSSRTRGAEASRLRRQRGRLTPRASARCVTATAGPSLRGGTRSAKDSSRSGVSRNTLGGAVPQEQVAVDGDCCVAEGGRMHLLGGADSSLTAAGDSSDTLHSLRLLPTIPWSGKPMAATASSQEGDATIELDGER